MISTLDRLREHAGVNGDNTKSHDPRVAGPTPLGRPPYVISAAESAECTCPEFCERDHEND